MNIKRYKDLNKMFSSYFVLMLIFSIQISDCISNTTFYLDNNTVETKQFLKKAFLSENDLLIKTNAKQSKIDPHDNYSITGVNWDNVQKNITITEDAFVGYNLFVLEEENRTDPFHTRTYSLFIVDMIGNIIYQRDLGISTGSALSSLNTEFINTSTLLYGTLNGPAFWNLKTNKTVELNFNGHHEYEFNPNNYTIFTLGRYSIEIESVDYLYDTIEEYNMTGHLIWSLDTRNFINTSQYCPFNDTIGIYADLTHGNTIFFDPDEDVFYYNARNVNTFYKIDHKSGEVIWGLGEYGNFSLYDMNGNNKNNLFYHAHAVEKIDNTTYILFDNDLHNLTNPNNHHSRILEIVINEETMTANESWTWISPQVYYSGWWGDADRLPNGNRIGTFGTSSHLDSSIGARIVEVSPQGEIVWEMNFPNSPEARYGIYRTERFLQFPGLKFLEVPFYISTEDVNVSFRTWYNFRAKTDRIGSYQVFLNGSLMVSGIHTFMKYWRYSDLTVSLGKLNSGIYNLTIVLADEIGYKTKETIMISVTNFFINREGPFIIEFGQEDSIMKWCGQSLSPLNYYIYFNDTLKSTGEWNGFDNISYNLNDLETGIYSCYFLLYNESKIVFNESFLVTIYPRLKPNFIYYPSDQEILWNQSLILVWEIFDRCPLHWELFCNESLEISKIWIYESETIEWTIPKLDEGFYNITIVLYDDLYLHNSISINITILPPVLPVIISHIEQNNIHWGQNTKLIWEVHGGTSWFLWKNSTLLHSGIVLDPIIEIIIQEWQAENWRLGVYNLTLQVVNAFGMTLESEVWITIFLDFGDVYADKAISSSSLWSFDIEKAEGAPDGEFAIIYVDYGNGYITLDMGENEEIINSDGFDVIVYSSEGIYTLWVGNDLSQPFTILGYGEGNQSFDLSSIGFSVARYVRVEYRSGTQVLLDAVEALNINVPEGDTKPPEILKKPEDVIITYIKNDAILLFWEVFDITPWNYTISIDSEIFETRTWDGSNIEFVFIVTAIGTFEIKLTLYDLFGNKSEDKVIIIIEEESTSSTTYTDTETYTTDETNSANSFFLTCFLVLSIICRNRYQKYVIKNNKKYKSH